MSTSTAFYYVRPTDTLFVRGNLAFGESGEHGASVMPPPPSLFAGAFRSALLGRDAAALARFAARRPTGHAALDACLGTAERPGSFRLSWLSLAASHAGRIEPIVPLPADMTLIDGRCSPLVPTAWPAGVQSAGALPLRAVLRTVTAAKPDGGIFLRETGLRAYLRGELPAPAQWLRHDALMRRDPRLGIGMDVDTRTAARSQLYTTEGFAFSPQSGPFETTGFLVGIQGMDGLLPPEGLLRLGGDGRSATWQQVRIEPPRCDLRAIERHGRFRLVLNTPAVFRQGWLPDGVTPAGDGLQLRGEGFCARLACASVGRRETVSGWDLLAGKPKPARAAAPAGSVYWFDRFEGSADKLAAWAESGVRTHTGAMHAIHDKRPTHEARDTHGAHAKREMHATPEARENDLARHAEGYNLGWLANWTPENTRP